MKKDQEDIRFTTGDIMKHCHVSRSTVIKWIKSGNLKAYKHPNGQFRITLADFAAFLNANTMPIDEELRSMISKTYR